MLQRTPGTFYVLTYHRGPAPLNTALAPMSVEQFATKVLWVTWLLAPALVFHFGNTFSSVLRVLLHAALAVAAGWVLAFAYVISAQALVAYGASPERLAQLYNSDGAPVAFALMFGWVPALLTVLLLWGVRSVVVRRRLARHGL